MSQKQILAVATAAIYHNGRRYEAGDEIEVTEKQFAELSAYLKPQEAALLAQQEAERQAKEQAETLAKQAEEERQALLDELAQTKQKHVQAEALATENGLRADDLEKQLGEVQQQLADKTAEVERLTQQLSKAKTVKNTTNDEEGKD